MDAHQSNMEKFLYKCPKCGGMNISLDISTGKKTCIDCQKDIKAKKVDIEEYRLDNVRKEEERFEALKQQGVQINIDVKRDKISDENYNILNKD